MPTPRRPSPDPRNETEALVRFERIAARALGLPPPTADEEAERLRARERLLREAAKRVPPVMGRAVLAANVRRLRTERNLSQEALAAEAGLYRTFVAAVERGQRNTSLDNICLLASALGVDPSTLLARH